MGRKRKVPASYNHPDWNSSSSDSDSEVLNHLIPLPLPPKLPRYGPSPFHSDAPSIPQSESSSSHVLGLDRNLEVAHVSPQSSIAESSNPSSTNLEKQEESNEETDEFQDADDFHNEVHDPLSDDRGPSYFGSDPEQNMPEDDQGSINDVLDADHESSGVEEDGEGETHDDIEDEVLQEDDYFSALDSLAEKWLLVELDHHVSKTAADSYWSLATKMVSKVLDLKKEQGVQRKTPQFPHLRRLLYKKHSIPVKMDFGYEHKTTGNTTVVQGVAKAPTSQFPPSEFKKLFEVASVKVISRAFLY